MACFRCGRYGHWESECYASTRSYDACFRCGRTSHWASECYASTRIDNSIITSSLPVTSPRPPLGAFFTAPSGHATNNSSSTKPNISPLKNAVMIGSMLGVQSAVSNGGDLMEKDDEGKTCLILAAELGKCDVIQALLQSCKKSGNTALMEMHDISGDTALCWA